MDTREAMSLTLKSFNLNAMLIIICFIIILIIKQFVKID